MASLRTVFERGERLAARAIVRTVDDPLVAEALYHGGRLGAAGLKRISQLRSGLVHVLALPSEGDLRSLSGEVATLRAAVVEVEAMLAESSEADG